VFVSWTVPDPWSYAYLLGMYLGDGWVGRSSRSTRLIVSLDARYPEIIQEVVTAAQLAGRGSQVKVRPKKDDACFIVSASRQSSRAAASPSTGIRVTEGERLLALVRLEDREAVLVEHPAHDRANRRVVLDQQHGAPVGRHGRLRDRLRRGVRRLLDHPKVDLERRAATERAPPP
jgi:hypothetical protein